MLSTTRTVGAVLLTANLVAANAWGAECVNRENLSALRTAAMQQELMVAALSCHDVSRYNHFVIAHQAELIDSDARLKSFFVGHNARSGEASYHTFKTELANSASLRSIRESDSFCSDARAKFDVASRSMNLSAFVAAQPLVLGVSYRLCRDNGRNMPLMAETSPGPAADRYEHRGDNVNEDDRYAYNRHRTRASHPRDAADDEARDDQ
jgi:hypothetical protein